MPGGNVPGGKKRSGNLWETARENSPEENERIDKQWEKQ